MKEIGVGLLGFGTVGAGVVQALKVHGDLLERRTGLKLALRQIADLDLDRDRGVAVDRSLLTRDAASVVDRSDVDIVIELIGGTRMARDLMERALRLGKPVVTANKALLAEHGEAMFDLAEARQADIFFEASVGGGIPVIRVLREGLVSNRILRLFGILNGTCNYILTRMEQARLSFDMALSEAQAAGYAEADPSLDIDGIDTAHKAVILASLAYGFHVPMAAVSIEGIRGLDAMDIQFAAELGYRIKLLAVIQQSNGEVEIRVHPTLMPLDHIMASVNDVYNAVLFDGDGVGEVLCSGRGAGRDPTASAVVSDVVDAARNLAVGAPRRSPGFMRYASPLTVRAIGDTDVRYYLRMPLLDEPGAFAQIATVLGRHGISIASLLQKEKSSGRHVPAIVITDRAKEKAFKAATQDIDQLSVVGAKTVRYRIEDF